MNNQKVRRGQVITTFGPGALYNLEHGSYIGMDLKDWPSNKGAIYEERLAKRLRTNYFIQPPSEEQYPKGLPYRRFPRWLFCRQCRVLQPYEKWANANPRRKKGDPVCCDRHKYRELVPMSFLVACMKGHLDDFPWLEWAHSRPKGECTQQYPLKYTKGRGGAGLGSSRITCTHCDASRNLQGSFSSNAFEKIKNCEGSKSWTQGGKKEGCDQRLVTVQRGGSNVYFPKTVSSITIPPYSSNLYDKVHKSPGYQSLATMRGRGVVDREVISTLTKIIAMEAEASEEEVRKIIASLDEPLAALDDEDDYRFQEYKAFHGQYDKDTNNSRDFDVLDATAGRDYGEIGIEKVFLVKSLREVRALVGFTRLQPLESDIEDYGKESSDKEIPRLVKLDAKSAWLPAVEVRGEGIFITLKPDLIDSWTAQKGILDRQAIINANYAKACKRRNTSPKSVSAKKVLLHTLSHLLMRQLSFECGYSEASLRERIYCNKESSAGKMQGILIYTAAGDADGTLGGLVRQGQPDRFEDIFRSMLTSSAWCSNDPLCIESKGQGFESLNLAACYACTLMPETSCEEFNRFLDRGFMLGFPGGEDEGFFSDKVIDAGS